MRAPLSGTSVHGDDDRAKPHGASARRRATPCGAKRPDRSFGHPSLFAALALGAFLVVVSTTAYPLFLSASGGALVRSAIDDPTVTRYGAGITYTVTQRSDSRRQSPDGHGLLIDRRLQLFDDAIGAAPAVGPVVEEAMGYEVAVTGPGGPGAVVRSAERRPVLRDRRARPRGRSWRAPTDPGSWLPDYVAEPLGAGPGDRVELRSGKAVVPVTVDGVYRALYAQPSTGYWRTWSGQLYPCPDCPLLRSPILVDRAQLIALATQLGSPRARFAIVAPVRADPPLSLDEAHRLSAFTNHFADQLGSRRSPSERRSSRAAVGCSTERGSSRRPRSSVRCRVSSASSISASRRCRARSRCSSWRLSPSRSE